MSKSTTSFLTKHRGRINKLVPWFLMLYFITNCLPYLFSRIYVLNSLFSNSIFSYILRFGMLGLFSLYGILLIYLNNLKKNKWLIVVLSFLMILSFLSNFLSPDRVVSYSLFFAGKINMLEWKLGAYDKLLDSFRFTAGCVFFYFLYTAFPYSFTKKEYFSYVVLPSIIIAAIGVIYILSFDLNTFLALVKDQISPEAGRSIFHSKNAFGIFLFEGAAAATYIFFTDKRTTFRLLVLLVPVFFIISYFVNCKLAAVCIFILLVLSVAYSTVYFFKRKPWVSYSILGSTLLLSTAIVLIFSIDKFHNSGLFAIFYNKIISLFTDFDITSFVGRTLEWNIVPRMTKGIFMWIGFGGAIGYSVVYSYTGLNGANTIPVADLHNAYVDFYAYHGIIGCLLLAIIYGFIVYHIYKLFKTNGSQALLISILLFVSVLFGMAETYTLFVSISANTFVLNFLIVVPLLFFRQGDINDEK